MNKSAMAAETTAGAGTQDVFLDLILEQSLERPQMDSGALHLLDRETGLLVPRVLQGPRWHSKSFSSSEARNAPWIHVLREGESLHFHDDCPQAEWREWLNLLQLRSAVIIPLKARGRIVGVMTLGSEANRRELTPAEIDELSELGTRAAMVIVYDSVVRASTSHLPELINNLGSFSPTQILENLLDFLLGTALNDSRTHVAAFVLYDPDKKTPCGALLKAVRSDLARNLKNELRQRLESLIELRNGNKPEAVTLFEGLPLKQTIPLQINGSRLGSLVLFKESSWVAQSKVLQRLGSIADQAARLIESIWRLRTVDRVIFTDPLTGLYTRTYWRQRAEQELDRCRRRSHPVSVFFLDIDFFKKVNDSYGHMVGDKVLCAAADAMKRSVRKHDVVARYGGEEFIALLAHANAENALMVANRLHSAIRNLRVTTNEGNTIRVTASGGLSTSEDGTASVDELIQNADSALYTAKRTGRNRICTTMQAAEVVRTEEPTANADNKGVHEVVQAAVARMCHEVNNPATVIMGAAELLLQTRGGTFDEATQTSLNVIIENAGRIGEVTRRMANIDRFVIREEAGIPIIDLPPPPPEE